MATRLPKQAFLAIAAVAWADGRMRRDEADGLLRAARASGLDGDELAALERATASALDLGAVELGELNRWQRALTYAFASWLARLDGVVNAEELATLRKLGAALELPQPTLASAASAAFDIACLPDGHRPEKYDFRALEERLMEKLPGSFRESHAPTAS
ncbi:MAG: hypothetical protein OZ921_16235 [Sorangiineae bacterium]|nr:hypothetical protein [Polyangiaceae bacterium]MEB2324062.1 hypothetical protein [Sorangiineae bacterium]